MNQSFYTGVIGAHQQLRRLNIHGNNIANVNTYGFKADRSRFTSLMYRNLVGIDQDLPEGVGVRLLMTSTNHSQGAPATGRDLDFMIDGDGFFALADLETGEITFTRNGAFYMSEFQRDSGEVDEEGEPIMETAYYLSDGQGRFVLSREGVMIEVTDPHTPDLPVGIFDYTNYDGMGEMLSTRYLPVDKNGDLWVGTGELLRGSLEMSNTDLADELTKVIESQRAYGLALKMVQTSDEIETTINNLRN